MHLGAKGLLLLHDGFSDMFGEDLNFGPRSGIDALHDFIERVTETRHVNACLPRIEVGIEIECGIEPLLVSLATDQDGLGHADHARASQPHVYRWLAVLNIMFK